MSRVAVFGGTTEGRALGLYLAARGVETHLFVATGYGEEIIEPTAGLSVTARRLDAAQMVDKLKATNPDAVVDATHPYAAEVTANIRAACDQTGLRYLRLVREEGGTGTGENGVCIHEVADTDEAAALLADMPGKALLTLGSKELAAFTHLLNWRERITARVLPSPDVVAGCAALGFHGQNLICMQGPFSHEMNVATLRQVGAHILVTKDSGREGGYFEKLSAAAETGVAVIVVRRPVPLEVGYSLRELKTMLGGDAEPTDGRQTDADKPSDSSHFPLFVPLGGRAVLVVGGGAIATRRVNTLLDFGAAVTVIAPEVSPELRQLAEQRRITWLPDRYAGEMDGFHMAVAATDNRDVNRRVGDAARSLDVLVSVADRREECTFWFPAVVRGGGLVAGITSENGDHAAVKRFAGSIRRGLEAEQ